MYVAYSSLAPAFLASAAGTETLQQQLLLRNGKAGTIDTTASSISDIWSSLYSIPRPSGAVAYKQSAWDKVAVASERETLTNSLTTYVGGDSTTQRRLYFSISQWRAFSHIS